MPLFPYPNMQELNLDWILTKVKNILRFVPDDGAVGQILRRTRSGAEWSDEQGAGGSVISVNGMQGAVVLDAADVGALPDSTSIPTDTADLTNGAGFVTAAGAAAAAPVQSVNGQTGAVVIPTGGAVDSVNGQTGTVVLDAADVGALPDSTSIPTDTADLTNGAGFVTAAGAASAAPVQSVNGQTGTVVIPAIKLVDIPQSAFTWNSGTSSFYCSDIYSAVPQLTSVPVGFFVFFTNGSAISGTRLQGNSLYVMGWIPNSSQSISSGYTFNCVAILRE